jgi:hypothetical protein
MADLRSTVGAINKRKKAWDDPFGDQEKTTRPQAKDVPSPPDQDDLLSDAAIDAEVKRRKAAQPKKGWFW